jgi:hypothetical protein
MPQVMVPMPWSRLTRWKHLLLAVAIGSGGAQAGNATASFVVSARLGQVDATAACHLDRATGAMTCAAAGTGSLVPGGSTVGSWQWNQLRYRNEVLLMEMPEVDSFRTFGAAVGAYSNIRLVNFGGLQYVEMTLSW